MGGRQNGTKEKAPARSVVASTVATWRSHVLPPCANGRQLADAGLALRPQLKVLFITGYAENAVVGNG
jgi:hypothetical protein